MDRGTLGDIVHGVTKSQTELSMCTHTHAHTQLLLSSHFIEVLTNRGTES